MVPSVSPVDREGETVGKQKKQMGSAEKANARARKEPQTAARKKARRAAQLTRELENKVNRALGYASPWETAKAIRARRGVRGAA